MRTDFSKTSADIAIESQDWEQRDRETLARQRSLSGALVTGSPRCDCLLCGGRLAAAERYRHRSVNYLLCCHCGHLQSQNIPPPGYPHAMTGSGFETVYPRLDRQAYESRRNRIYRPKLEWALLAMAEAGSSAEQAIAESWLELGCGAGYFLDALREKGCRNFLGLDENAQLVATAEAYCGEGAARCTDDMLSDLAASSAKNVAAFFVLEHLDQGARFWRIMSEKPAGTVLLFAVPTFGFATMLEGAFDDFAARNLDNVLHTQLYTDRSIDFALSSAGYEKAAEWLFGQDASDLCRVLVGRIRAVAGDSLAERLGTELAGLADPLQAAIDRARLCDARHILAVKR